MTIPNGDNWDMFADIAAVTRWLDANSSDIPGDDAMRVMKIGEEIGEAQEVLAALSVTYGRAAAAYIGMTGQNPRKGITHTQADLCAELADVAITALCAMAHFTRAGFGTYRPEIVRGIVAAKLTGIMARSGIPPFVPIEPLIPEPAGARHIVAREPGPGDEFRRAR